jgi:hypothetical protein
LHERAVAPLSHVLEYTPLLTHRSPPPVHGDFRLYSYGHYELRARRVRKGHCLRLDITLERSKLCDVKTPDVKGSNIDKCARSRLCVALRAQAGGVTRFMDVKTKAPMMLLLLIYKGLLLARGRLEAALVCRVPCARQTQRIRFWSVPPKSAQEGIFNRRKLL